MYFLLLWVIRSEIERTLIFYNYDCNLYRIRSKDTTTYLGTGRGKAYLASTGNIHIFYLPIPYGENYGILRLFY
jgi:hypothetical protein